MPTLERKRNLRLLVSEGEMEMVQQLATRVGLTVADWIRTSIRQEHERHFGIVRAVAALTIHSNAAAPVDIAQTYSALTAKACSKAQARALCEASDDIVKARGGRYKLRTRPTEATEAT